MRRQRGQSAVEFALMAPVVFLLIFGMIYGGVMFMDYLNFNNYARTIAREVSLASTEKDRELLVKKYTSERYQKMGVGVYEASVNVKTDEEDVTVTIHFSRKESFLMMPKEFNIVYSMKLEETDNTT